MAPEVLILPSPVASRHGWGRARGWLPAAVALLLLACYWRTLAPTLTGGDSGELAAAVHTLGIPHPTGYPLYCLVGKLFDLLPLGEPAHRLALFSAVAGAGAGAALTWLLLALTGSVPGALLGGLAFGLNSWTWGQANRAEVYALHALLVCLALAAFAHWLSAPSPRRLYLLAALAGLGLAHHRTSLFFTAPLLLWAVWASRPPRPVLARAALALALPLLLYAWLPLRSALHPPLDWGHTSGSFGNFWRHLNAAFYLQFAFRASPGELGGRLMETLGRFWGQFGPLGLALAALGLGALLRRPQRPLGAVLLLGAGASALWGLCYLVSDYSVFLAPAAWVVAVWAGAGLAYALDRARAAKLAPALARLVPVAGMLLALGIPGGMLVRNAPVLDRSEAFSAWERAKLVTSDTPPSAVLLLFQDAPYFGALYRYHALAETPAPQVLSVNLCLEPWHDALLAEPGLRQAAAWARSTGSRGRVPRLVAAMRQALDPRRPLYTNVPPAWVPEGFVLLDDYTIKRLVASPGLPLLPDQAGTRPLFELPGGVGALLAVELPEAVGRGETFRISADLHWSALVPPDADLQIVLTHPRVAAAFAQDLPADLARAAEWAIVRPVPLLFRVEAPATPAGRHYRMTFSALASSRLHPGRYLASVRLVRGELHTPFVPCGSVAVR